MSEERVFTDEIDDSWTEEPIEVPAMDSAVNPSEDPEPEPEPEPEAEGPAQSPDMDAEEDEDEIPAKEPEKPSEEPEEKTEPEPEEKPEEPEKAPEEPPEAKEEEPKPEPEVDPELGIPNDILDKELPITVLGEKQLRSVRDLIGHGKQAEELNVASRKRLQEAATYTRSAKQAVDLVMQNPLTAAIQLWTGHLGGDRDAAERQVLELVKPGVASLMQELLEEDPTRREQLRTHRRNAEEIEFYRKQAEERQRLDQERQQKEAQEAAEKEIQAAFDKLQVERTQELQRQAAFVIQQKAQEGITLNAEQAIREALRVFGPPKPKVVKPDFSALDPSELYEKHPDFIAKLREFEKKRAEAARSSNRVTPPTANASKRSSRRDGAKAKSLEDAFNIW